MEEEEEEEEERKVAEEEADGGGAPDQLPTLAANVHLLSNSAIIQACQTPII